MTLHCRLLLPSCRRDARCRDKSGASRACCVAASVTKREHVRRAQVRCKHVESAFEQEAFSLGQHRARAALGSRTTASLNASRIYFIRTSSECVSHDSSELERILPR